MGGVRSRSARPPGFPLIFPVDRPTHTPCTPQQQRRSPSLRCERGFFVWRDEFERQVYRAPLTAASTLTSASGVASSEV